MNQRLIRTVLVESGDSDNYVLQNPTPIFVALYSCMDLVITDVMGLRFGVQPYHGMEQVTAKKVPRKSENVSIADVQLNNFNSSLDYSYSD